MPRKLTPTPPNLHFVFHSVISVLLWLLPHAPPSHIMPCFLPTVPFTMPLHLPRLTHPTSFSILSILFSSGSFFLPRPTSPGLVPSPSPLFPSEPRSDQPTFTLFRFYYPVSFSIVAFPFCLNPTTPSSAPFPFFQPSFALSLYFIPPRPASPASPRFPFQPCFSPSSCPAPSRRSPRPNSCFITSISYSNPPHPQGPPPGPCSWSYPITFSSLPCCTNPDPDTDLNQAP